MSRIVNNETPEGLRVECPHPGCDDAVPESEWEIKDVTDHLCSKGHWFRIEGQTIDDLLFYRIDPTVVEFENLV